MPKPQNNDRPTREITGALSVSSIDWGDAFGAMAASFSASMRARAGQHAVTPGGVDAAAIPATIEGMPFTIGTAIGGVYTFPAFGDFNNDGWLEPFGLLNNGNGTFNDAPSLQIASILAAYPGRINRDARVLDLDGDGNLDAVWNVYSDPTQTNSFTLLLYGDGMGGFSRVEEWRDVRGFGETIVAADFDNDGDTDLYIPVYTHVDGSDSNYLFLNQGDGTFGPNVAGERGAGLSNLPAFYRVEGAEGADVNFDGLIDMFVGSHLFINEGGSFSSVPLDPWFFDEGASLFDFDNDGDFDLVVRGENLGPRLFEWDGAGFVDRGSLTGAEYLPGFGINVADFDGNGWEDIVIGSTGGLSIFLNYEGTFQRYFSGTDAGVLDAALKIEISEEPCCGLCQHAGPGVCEALAVGDVDGDGRLDIIGRAGGLVHFQNLLDVGDVMRLMVLSETGVQDQFGRSVRLTPRAGSDLVMARSVESGSGYLSQNQYEMFIGLPVAGAYDVEIFFRQGTYRFVAGADQSVSAFADGRVTIVGGQGGDIMGGGSGRDLLSGGGGDDLLLGSLGADVLDGGTGVDGVDYSSLASGVVVDLTAGTAQVAGDSQTLTGIENVVGGDFADSLTGDAGSNILTGGGGSDFIDGGAGADIMRGGAGNDIYVVADAGDVVVELAGEGVDEVRTSLASYTLADNVERVRGTADSGQTLTGNALANEFSGGLGADRFLGSLGDDIYVVMAGDVVVELAGEGDDEVRTALADYTLTENVERLIGTAAFGQRLVGNALGNFLAGNDGANTLIGGGGDDVYVVSGGDVVIELADQGIDEVRTALASYTLTDHVERLTGTAAAGQILIGNGLANILSGGPGGNRLEGRGGDDVYLVNFGDVVVELAGEGIDEVRTALQVYTLTDNVENVVGLSSLGQKLIGNDLDNVFRSVGGLDILIGRGGNDTYFVEHARVTVTEAAGGGFDTIRTTVDFYLDSATDVEALGAADAGGTSALTLVGNGLNNVITGNAGANILDGGGGVDTLIGLGGDDRYVIRDTRSIIVEVAGEGDDIVLTRVDFALTDAMSVESMAPIDYSSTTPLRLTGNASANVIVGNAGNNVLDGRGGADILWGREGNDTYYVDHAGDQIIEGVGEGDDLILTSINYVLSDAVRVENLSTIDWSAVTAINITGNADRNVLVGNAGANILDGGGGADLMQGLGGDDSYVVDNAGDRIIEDANGGNDRVLSKISFALAPDANVEQLAAWDPASTTPLILEGNAFTRSVTGNAGANSLFGQGAVAFAGLGGDDRYFIEHSASTVSESAGEGDDIVLTSVSYVLQEGASVESLSTRDWSSTDAINLTGNQLANVIIGNAGANILNGGGGGDILSGLGGDDRYIVDHLATQIYEAATEGNDILLTSVDYALAEGVYVESLSTRDWTSTAAIRISGNGIANQIVGNDGDNVLDGGGGADVLQGRRGNDTYIVDNVADRIVEFAGEGDDVVRTTVSYTLAGNAHVETLAAFDAAGTSPISLTGNTLANTIIGNAGANILIGGGGADTLVGLGGDDRYRVTDSDTQVVENAGEGTDLILTSVDFALAAGMSVEGLSTSDWLAVTPLNLSGNELANTLGGNAGSNRLDGGSGNDIIEGRGGSDVLIGGDGDDILYGGAGDDVLTGGAGRDSFRFEGPAPGADTITDFQTGLDRIDLRAFGIGITEVTMSGVQNGTLLEIDFDRNGIADFSILLSGAPAPLATDFVF